MGSCSCCDLVRPGGKGDLFHDYFLVGYSTISTTNFSHKSVGKYSAVGVLKSMQKSDGPFDMTNEEMYVLDTIYPLLGKPQRRGLAEGATPSSVLEDMEHQVK